MKTIALKTTKEKVVVNGKSLEVDISISDLITTALNAPVKGGYTASDMLTRVRLLDKVEKAKDSDTLELEDAEYKELGRIVSTASWSIVSRSIAEFIQSFDNK